MRFILAFFWVGWDGGASRRVRCEYETEWDVVSYSKRLWGAWRRWGGLRGDFGGGDQESKGLAGEWRLIPQKLYFVLDNFWNHRLLFATFLFPLQIKHEIHE